MPACQSMSIHAASCFDFRQLSGMLQNVAVNKKDSETWQAGFAVMKDGSLIFLC